MPMPNRQRVELELSALARVLETFDGHPSLRKVCSEARGAIVALRWVLRTNGESPSEYVSAALTETVARHAGARDPE